MIRLRSTLAAAALGLAALLVPAPATAQDAPPPGAPTTATPGPDWSDAILESAALLPVQDGGRVKPLSTLASFKLLRMNGRRSYTNTDGRKVKATEWLLDCVFFPQRASRQPFFLVENDEVLDAVGVAHEGRKKRDRYAYDDLAPARREIFRAAMEYQEIDAKDRTPVQQQMLRLAESMSDFESLSGFLEFARHPVPVDAHPDLQALFDGRETAAVSEILARDDAVVGLAQSAPAGTAAEARAVQGIFSALNASLRSSARLRLIPPPTPVEDFPEWMSPMAVASEVLGEGRTLDRQIEVLAALEALEAAKTDPAAFETALGRFHEVTQALADERGEYAKVPLEVSYYRANWFTNALVFFLLGFVLVGLSWLWPASRGLRLAAPVPVVIGAVLVTIGITLRCVIRGRPPVSTLYETILFVTGSGVLTCLVLEWINRKRIAVAVATFMGALGMFLANRYEAHEAVDTMPSLVAVLDTNFWLATHVTTITIGYAAGLFAAAVAHVWVFGKVFGLRKDDAAFYRGLTRMTYGLIAFGLLFSTVGTILGGIWANDSWGRFWGWDPKENGALMICLWMLVQIHARLGGYIQQFGIAMTSIFGGMIVAFSWWGVNLLGIGLHSYGFTTGAMLGLMIFYGIEVAVMALAFGHRLLSRSAGKAAAAAA